MSTLRISNIEAKADNSSPTVDEQLKFTNSTGDVMLHLDGRTSGITTVGINTTAQTIKFDENNNVYITGIVTATELHGTVAVGTSVTYGDNEKAYFGTGLDLQIFHNNSDSVISQSAAGTGNLKILSGGAQSIECVKAGAVNIAHNGTTKLVTTSTGISVTGQGVFSSAITASTYIQGTSSNGGLKFYSDSSASKGVTLNTDDHLIPSHDSNSDLGLTGTRWRNVYADTLYGDGSNLTNLPDTDSITEGNSYAEVLDTGTNGIFRFVSEGNERLRITHDAKVGINTNNPSAPLEIQGDAGVNDAALYFTRHGSPPNDAVIGQLLFRKGTDSVAVIQAKRESALDDAYISMLTQKTGGSVTERLRIASNGVLLFGTTTAASSLRAVFQGYSDGGENFQARIRFQSAQATNLVTNSHIANLLFTNASGSEGARIDVKADANWGSGSYPSRIEFSTTASSANAPTERLRILSGGQVNIGDNFGQTTYKTQIEATDQNVLRLVTDSDDANGVELVLRKDSASPADNDNIGNIYFQGNDDSGASTFYASMEAYSSDVSNNSEDGYIRFRTRNNGSMGERLRITSDGNVGINESSPQQQLHVHDDTTYHGIFVNGSAAPRITFARSTTTTGEWSVGIDGTNGNNFAINNSGDNSNNKIVISSSQVSLYGAVSVPNGNVVMGSGRGIDFSATGDGSGTDSSELLDDYEEGTWTPTAHSGGSSVTTSSATYTKIGRIVHIQFRGSLNGTNGNVAQIGGLPYANWQSYAHQVGPVMHNGFDYSGSTEPTATSYITGTNSYFQLYYSQTNSNGWHHVTGSETGGDQFITSLTYFVA